MTEKEKRKIDIWRWVLFVWLVLITYVVVDKVLLERWVIITYGFQSYRQRPQLPTIRLISSPILLILSWIVWFRDKKLWAFLISIFQLLILFLDLVILFFLLSLAYG